LNVWVKRGPDKIESKITIKKTARLQLCRTRLIETLEEHVKEVYSNAAFAE